jgi:COMPASS component SWD1
MGGAGHKAAHNVFIWDRESGVLVKVLEGPKESLGDCEVSQTQGSGTGLRRQWHPTRPIIASTTISGDVQIWQTSTPDNWAAFAPGFEELEENVEYDELEDEFDIVSRSLLNVTDPSGRRDGIDASERSRRRYGYRYTERR